MCGIAIVKISNILFKNWLKTCIMVSLQQPLSKIFVKKGVANQQTMGIWNVGIQFSKFIMCKTYTCKNKLNIPKLKFICHRSIKIHLFWNKSIIIFSNWIHINWKAIWNWYSQHISMICHYLLFPFTSFAYSYMCIL